MTFLALGNAWVENVQIPAFEIQDGKHLKFQRPFLSNSTIAFLARRNLPDPKLLSESASKLLSVSHKVAEYALSHFMLIWPLMKHYQQPSINTTVQKTPYMLRVYLANGPSYND